MLKLLVLLTLSATLMACHRLLADASLTVDSYSVVMSPSVAMIQTVTLAAREERLPAPGAPAAVDRPIGFADLLLRLENPQQETVNVTIQSVQIRSVSTGEVQMERSMPETVVLKPLENAVTDVHLTNRVGYRSGDRVKAVVTYRIGEVQQVIESNPVDITRP